MTHSGKTVESVASKTEALDFAIGEVLTTYELSYEEPTLCDGELDDLKHVYWQC